MPSLDVVRVQDVGLTGASDEVILEWAASATRILLSHDIKTVPPHAKARVEYGLPMPGVLVTNRYTAISTVVEDLLVIAECSESSEWRDRVQYIPL